MKRLFAIFALLGAISGSVLQSAAIGMIALAATDSPEVAFYATIIPFALSFVLPASKSRFAFITFTEGICEKVQSSLLEIYGQNTPSVKRTQVGYLQALTSPQNTAGMQMIPIPSDGKKRQVRVKYTQRGTRHDLTTTEITDCSTTIEKAPFEETIDVTNYFGTKGIKFQENEMRKLCGTDKQWMAEIVSNEMNALAEQLNIYLLQNQSSNFGIFFGGSSSVKSVQMLQGSNNNAAHFYGESTIMEDIENLDESRKPIVIGSGKLGHYVRQVGIGCCNTLGQDIGQAGNMDFFRDRFVGNVLGNADDFVLLIPGYVQLLTWNKYVGEYAKESANFSHGTITDPFTGITYDMKWNYNNCDDTYSLQIGLNWESYFMPSNAFSAYDELSGYNGSLHYRATSA